jgi:L-malate glycosyltransferase
MVPSGENQIASSRILIIGPQVPPYGGMALQAEKLERLLRREGHLVVFLPSNLPFPRPLGFVERLRGIRPFIRCSVFTWKLRAAIVRADVVHVLAASWLYFFLVVGPAVLLSRLFGKRVILNYRSGLAPDFFRSLGWMAAPLFRLASEVTAPSSFLAGAIHDRFGVPVKIVPNIVDFSAHPYRQRNSFVPRLLVTRHLEKIYGVDSVLRAFAKIRQRFPDATLEIAGSGGEEQSLRALAGELGLENVHFCGYVPHTELPALYSRSDILLNGSHFDNFPGSLMEASASGLAVVSTSAGGIPALYENNKTAILVEPGNWHGLAAGVEALIDNPALGVRLTMAALRLCRQCEWESVREALHESYGFVQSPKRIEELGASASQDCSVAKYDSSL